MKTRQLFILSVLAVSLSLAIFNSSSEGSQYRGEVTWLADVTETETGPLPPGTIQFLVKAGISYVGGNYYTFQAFIDMTPDNPAVYSGGGVLIGNDLIVTGSGAQAHIPASPFGDTRDADKGQLKVNKNTLDGTIFIVGRRFDNATKKFTDYYFYGTLTLQGPTIPLSQGLGYLPLILK